MTKKQQDIGNKYDRVHMVVPEKMYTKGVVIKARLMATAWRHNHLGTKLIRRVVAGISNGRGVKRAETSHK